MMAWIKENLLLTALSAVILAALLFGIYGNLNQRKGAASVSGEIYPAARMMGFNSGTNANIISPRAMSAAKAQGYKTLVVPFNLTSDGKAVCIQGWGSVAVNNFGKAGSKGAVTYQQFITLPTVGGTKGCTAERLAGWLEGHPDTSIIVTTRNPSKSIFKQLKEAIPNYKKYIIPQVHSGEEYENMQRLGYSRMIYFFNGTDINSLMAEIKKHPYYAVALPKSLQNGPEVVKALNTAKVRIYVDNIANCEEFNKFKSVGVTSAYFTSGKANSCGNGSAK